MEKFSDKLKNTFSQEASLRRIPLYFFITCVLLVVLIFKIGETNNYLQIIAENGGVLGIHYEEKTEDEKVNIIIETEENEDIGDVLPMYEFLEAQKDESTTIIEDSTINSSATTYVINKDSKKIHKEDCSFSKRMNEENKLIVKLTPEELNEYFENGYTLCTTCKGE